MLGDQLAAMRPALLALGRRLTRDESAAEDVVQSAFEKVLLHGGEFQGRSALRTWVWRIATNEAIDLHRARAREQRLHAAVVERAVEPLVAVFESPGESLERRLRGERVRAGIASLSARDREILEFWAQSERSDLERRGRSGRTCARTLRTRLFRARQRLRRALADLS
jgi:RNA polymerase sigma-70 factor (ECF subfamily)